MKKKILFSMLAIAAAAAVVIGGTTAFFSSSATSSNNTFSAGTLGLKLSNIGSPYNWQSSVSATWNFSNMMPGGTPSVDTLYVKNAGTVDGKTIGLTANSTETIGGFENYVRITSLTFGGQNLLTGGAGATIPAYETSNNCNVYVNPGTYSTITSAITGAPAGSVICVGPGNYTTGYEGGPIIINNSVSVVSTDGPGTTTITGNGSAAAVTISAANVTLKGFSITNPGSGYGVLVQGVPGVQILENNIHDIATTLASGSAQAVYLTGIAGLNGFTVKDNTINNIGNLNLVYGSSGSVKGVYIGDTSGVGTVSGVVIENNVITNVKASTAAWTAGRGAYGIMTNYGGSVSGLVVKNNTINGLEGLWSHAIGLEGLTPNASVTLNDISNLVDHKSPSDSVGVRIEDNGATVINISQNNFAPNVAYGVSDVVTGSTPNAQNNWWGDFDPSDNVIGSGVDYSNFAGGPFVGFVGGTDQNLNGFADMQDLRLTGIANATPGLTAGQIRALVMGVQIDGPSTNNTYQGATLHTDITVTLQQQ